MADKKNNRIRPAVDISMTALLLCLMAYQITGEALHEWFGILMTVILIVHNILNRKWYSSLFKGKSTGNAQYKASDWKEVTVTVKVK
jgi:hypothetical protein